MKKQLLLGALLLSMGGYAQKQIKSSKPYLFIQEGEYKIDYVFRINSTQPNDTLFTDSKELMLSSHKDTLLFSGQKEGDTFTFDAIYNGTSTPMVVQYAPSKIGFSYHKEYLPTLKQGKNYKDTENNDKIIFRYASSSDSDLVRLKEKYHLDSIAGEGSEINQIINIMRWVHNTIEHDGSAFLRPGNAIAYLDKYAHTNKGINCRGLATVLNECYLALGFPSRFVTCMPRASQFDDCHVINAVYSKELEKWIWMDPTNEAYVMDEKGTLLSIQEVRERLIQDKTLIVNPDANWNHLTPIRKEMYLDHYMAKNLYRMSCSTYYQFGTEEKNENQVIELQPLGSDPKTQKTPDYKTIIHNTTLFWEKPQQL